MSSLQLYYEISELLAKLVIFLINSLNPTKKENALSENNMSDMVF